MTNNLSPAFENATPTGRMHVPGQEVMFAAWMRKEYPVLLKRFAVGSLLENGTLCHSKCNAWSRIRRERERMRLYVRYMRRDQ